MAKANFILNSPRTNTLYHTQSYCVRKTYSYNQHDYPQSWDERYLSAKVESLYPPIPIPLQLYISFLIDLRVITLSEPSRRMALTPERLALISQF